MLYYKEHYHKTFAKSRYQYHRKDGKANVFIFAKKAKKNKKMLDKIKILVYTISRF